MTQVLYICICDVYILLAIAQHRLAVIQMVLLQDPYFSSIFSSRLQPDNNIYFAILTMHFSISIWHRYPFISCRTDLLSSTDTYRWYYKVDKRTGHHRIVGGWGDKIKTREGKPDRKQRHWWKMESKFSVQSPWQPPYCELWAGYYGLYFLEWVSLRSSGTSNTERKIREEEQ